MHATLKAALITGSALALSISAAQAASMAKAGMDKRVADLEREITLMKSQVKQAMMGKKGPDRGVVSSTAAKVRFYGQVNRAIRFASTPSKSSFQSVDNGESNSRFGLVADAKMNPNTSIRGQLEMGWHGAGRGLDFDEGTGKEGGMSFRHSTISMTHKDMGTLSLGHSTIAGGGSYFQSFAGTGLAFGVGGGANDGITATQDGNDMGVARHGAPFGLFAHRRGRVLYRSPSLMGATVEASYNEGDEWSVGGYLAGLPGVKAVGVRLGAGYRHEMDGDKRTFGISGGVKHNASGISVNGWYAQERHSGDSDGSDLSGWMADVSWTGSVVDTGATSLTVSYGVWKKGDNGKTERYFAAANQNVDAAATQIYGGVSHDTGTDDDGNDRDGVFIIITGVRIRF